MNKYHKIQSVYKRDPATNYKTFLTGEWSRPEFGYLADNQWVFTEKVDGTNIRLQWEYGLLKIKGKTDAAQMYPGVMEWFMNHKDRIADAISVHYPDLNSACFYGEGYGPGIQKGGGNYCDSGEFVLFDIMVGDYWLTRIDVSEIGTRLSIPVVPIIGMGPLQNAIDWVQEGIYSHWGDFLAEGIVARPLVELCARNGQRIITKIKTKDFEGA